MPEKLYLTDRAGGFSLLYQSSPSRRPPHIVPLARGVRAARASSANSPAQAQGSTLRHLRGISRASSGLAALWRPETTSPQRRHSRGAAPPKARSLGTLVPLRRLLALRFST